MNTPVLSLLSALCFEEGTPTRTNQEQCVRALWMAPLDRYAFGLTLHEINTPAAHAAVKAYGQPPRSRWDRAQGLPPRAVGASVRFLGDDAWAASGGGRSGDGGGDGGDGGGAWHPVCVAWKAPATPKAMAAASRSEDDALAWAGNCGALWWGASRLGLGGAVVGSLDVASLDTNPNQPPPLPGSREVGALDLISVEHLLWPLEPERLCPLVTGVAFNPDLAGESSVGGSGSVGSGGGISGGGAVLQRGAAFQGRERAKSLAERGAAAARFRAHRLLAEYDCELKTPLSSPASCWHIPTPHLPPSIVCL